MLFVCIGHLSKFVSWNSVMLAKEMKQLSRAGDYETAALLKERHIKVKSEIKGIHHRQWALRHALDVQRLEDQRAAGISKINKIWTQRRVEYEDKAKQFIQSIMVIIVYHLLKRLLEICFTSSQLHVDLHNNFIVLFSHFLI